MWCLRFSKEQRRETNQSEVKPSRAGLVLGFDLQTEAVVPIF